MSKKEKYTAGQKRAYYSGQGYRTAYEGKTIPFKSEKNRESFRQGWASVTVKISKYPDLKSKKKG